MFPSSLSEGNENTIDAVCTIDTSDVSGSDNTYDLDDASEPMAMENTEDFTLKALNWVYSFGALPNLDVVVLGLGSGQHVSALIDLESQIRITVIETREELIAAFHKNFPELKDKVKVIAVKSWEDLAANSNFADIMQNRSYVINYIECWADQGELFADLYRHLTGRSAESGCIHLNDLGIKSLTALDSEEFKDKRFLTIKDLFPIVEVSELSERKRQIFYALRELVK